MAHDSHGSSPPGLIEAKYVPGQTTAVVVQGERRSWGAATNSVLRGETLEAFQLREVVQDWRLNNAALKWIRDTNEDPRGHPTVDSVDLSEADVVMIGVLVRAKGMDYFFAHGESQPWSWRQMIASLSQKETQELFGTDGQELTRIACAPPRGSHDHKRHHAANSAGKPIPKGAPTPIWDFVVERSDGAVFRLHPNQTRKQIHMTCHVSSYPTKPPRTGPGGSEGPGTYKYYKQASYPAGPSAVAVSAASGSTEAHAGLPAVAVSAASGSTQACAGPSTQVDAAPSRVVDTVASASAVAPARSSTVVDRPGTKSWTGHPRGPPAGRQSRTDEWSWHDSSTWWSTGQWK
jgi:hypothetical protein